jgi:polysaccharide biosynthesis/export protein
MQKLLGIVCTILIVLLFNSSSLLAQGVPPVGNPFKNPYAGNGNNAKKDASVATPATKEDKQNPDKKKTEDAKKKAEDATSKKNDNLNKEGDADNKNGDTDNKDTKQDDIANEEDKDRVDQGPPVQDPFAVQQQQLQNSIYGQAFLNSGVNLQYADQNNYTTPPASYKVGPGDELIINVWGTSQLQETYKVGKDGAIYPSLCGRINVGGLSFAAARQIISGRLRSALSEGSKVDVQLAGGRYIKVTVLGEVNTPGTFTMSAFNTAFNAITRAGGVTNLANLREIQIKRNGITVNTLDLYEFLNTGDFGDAYLEDGDMIMLGTYDKKVKAEGKFKRPMYYLLKQEEDLSDLIRYSGGPTYDARFSNIQVQSVVDEQPVIYSINLKEKDAENYTVALREGDVVRIKLINIDVMNKVIVSGAVTYPDEYQVEAGDRLLSILKKAGGILPTALDASIFIYRGDSNANGQTIKVDLRNITSDNSLENIELFPFDSVVIVDKAQLQKRYSIEIIGAVNNPGTYSYSRGMTVRDLITLCGGFRLDAESERIEISRVIDNIVDNYQYNEVQGGNLEFQRLVINPNLEKVDSNAFLLKPMDKVFVRVKAAMLANQLVSIQGAVYYPGQYPLLFEGEPLSSLIQRAGGLRKTAFLDGLTFTRANVGQIAINLRNDSVSLRNYKNIILVEGDNISIPVKQTLIAVKGEVQNNIILQADSNNSDVEYYINAAGGFGDNPWKDKIYVQYPNGVNRGTRKFLFGRVYPKVIPGCIIMVPKKPARQRGNSWDWRDTQGFVITIMSITTTAVTTWKLLTLKGN